MGSPLNPDGSHFNGGPCQVGRSAGRGRRGGDYQDSPLGRGEWFKRPNGRGMAYGYHVERMEGAGHGEEEFAAEHGGMGAQFPQWCEPLRDPGTSRSGSRSQSQAQDQQLQQPGSRARSMSASLLPYQAQASRHPSACHRDNEIRQPSAFRGEFGGVEQRGRFAPYCGSLRGYPNYWC